MYKKNERKMTYLFSGYGVDGGEEKRSDSTVVWVALPLLLLVRRDVHGAIFLVSRFSDILL